ncbi:MAG: radical SAM protein, partial [Vicinamibacterales bacterium]
MFNLRVPLETSGEVFLMNTLTDAQLLVSSDVAALLDSCPDAEELSRLSPERRDETSGAIDLLREHGFLVSSHDADRRELDRYLTDVKTNTSELNITVLTTLQCNFACDYCFQGDHGDYNKFAEKMSLETAARLAEWVEREMDRIHPERLLVTFFGGEPLLNLPVMYFLAERFYSAAVERGIDVGQSIITNGLLLTEDVVDQMLPYAFKGAKITLDGDRDTHNRLRPLRGGQGTFDRIIENVRRVAGKCAISIGGNFDETSADSYPALLDFLREQDFADTLIKVNFKPIVRNPETPAATVPTKLKGMLPLIPVAADGRPLKPLGGTCMTAAGDGGGTSCDSCDFLDDKMTFLRDEAQKRGFPTPDGVHNGPCHVHMDHAHTIGPDGSLYACPGFTGEKARSTGHID